MHLGMYTQMIDDLLKLKASVRIVNKGDFSARQAEHFRN